MSIPKLGQEPPSRVLLWRWGANPTARGTFWLTKDNAKKIIDMFNERGNPLVFDVDHSAFDKKAEIKQKVAVGFSASLLLDDQGLWADNMLWNDLGTKLVKAGGFVFDSPVVLVSAQNVITKLIAGSITNFPAKNNAQPLLFSIGASMDEELMSKVKPLREMQFALGAILNSLQKTMELYNSGEIDELCKSMGSQIPDWSMSLSKFVDTVDPEGKTLPSDEETEEEETEEKKIEIEVPIQNTAKEDEVVTLSEDPAGVPEVQEDASVLKASILALNDNNKILEQSLEALKKEAENLKKQSKIDRGIIEHKIPVAEKEKFMSFSDAALDAYLQIKKPIINMFSDISQPKEEIKTIEDVSTDSAKKVVDEIFARIRR